MKQEYWTKMSSRPPHVPLMGLVLPHDFVAQLFPHVPEDFCFCLRRVLERCKEHEQWKYLKPITHTNNPPSLQRNHEKKKKQKTNMDMLFTQLSHPRFLWHVSYLHIPTYTVPLDCYQLLLLDSCASSTVEE